MGNYKGNNKAGHLLPARGPGRPPGVPNKITNDIKELILKSLALTRGDPGIDGKPSRGGVHYLVKQSRDNPVAYLGLLGRVLPLQVTGAGGGPIVIGWERPAIEGPIIDQPGGDVIDG